MTEPKTISEVISLIESSRKLLDERVARLTDEQLTAPALDNGRSVKDTLGHITAWEQKMLLWLAQSIRGEIPDRPAPDEEWPDIDAMNHDIYEDNLTKSLEQVLNESKVSYDFVLAAISVMDEPDLFDGDRFPWRKGFPMCTLVEGNTWAHYDEHRQEIERAFPVS